jgi:sugar phosphate isomerase/epimerase
MQLAVSNLAWNQDNAEEVYAILSQNNLLVETVFSKIDSWDNLTERRILEYKSSLDRHGLTTKSAQSLFFGVDCTLGDEKFFNHFQRLIEYSKILGITTLVFGSPNLRKNASIAGSVFQKLDKMLESSGILVVIEPNARKYGGEYFFTVSEIVQFIEKHKLQNIHTMIDTHNLWLEGEDPVSVYMQYAPYIKHIHASEDKLLPIVTDRHLTFANLLFTFGYSIIVTYELLSCPNLSSTVQTFSELYGKQR